MVVDDFQEIEALAELGVSAGARDACLQLLLLTQSRPKSSAVHKMFNKGGAGGSRGGFW
jgi:hypothetical protein